MSSLMYTDEWRNLNLRPRPWPSTNDLLEQIEDRLEHFGIDDWGPLCHGGGTRRGSPLMWPRVVMRTSERWGYQDGIDVYRSELERLIKFLKQLKRSKAVAMVDAQRIMGPGDRTLKELKRVLFCHHQLVGKGLRGAVLPHYYGNCRRRRCGGRDGRRNRRASATTPITTAVASRHGSRRGGARRVRKD
eukprot:COSAG06_NODE_125_length_22852_cov_90.031205_13_plen_189_part_00